MKFVSPNGSRVTSFFFLKKKNFCSIQSIASSQPTEIDEMESCVFSMTIRNVVKWLFLRNIYSNYLQRWRRLQTQPDNISKFMYKNKESNQGRIRTWVSWDYVIHTFTNLRLYCVTHRTVVPIQSIQVLNKGYYYSKPSDTTFSPALRVKCECVHAT